MATSVTFNGTSYSIPANREPRGWGTSLSAFLVDVANSALSKAGGNFTLTADTNFGSTYGLVVKYIKSVSSNIAASGVIRLANTDKIAFRNNANGADLSFGVSTSDRLQFESVNIPTISSTDTLTNKTIDGDTNTLQDIGISSLKTEAGDANKVLLRNGAGAVVSDFISNGNVTSGAGIALNKLAAVTAAQVLLGNGSGVVTGTTLSGDVTVNSSGTTAIGSGKVTNAMLAGSIDLTSKVTGVLPVANGGTGLSALGTGVATFLGTPSSANLRSALTDETGTGAAVFANTPTLVTPVLDPQSSTPSYAKGLLWYDSNDETMRYYNDSTSDSVNIGQEINVKVRNTTGSTITAGQVVRVNGAVGGVPTVALAQANSFANSRVFAVVTESIANNTNGYATVSGLIKNLNLSAFSDGDVLYLSTSVAGGLTATRPTAGNYEIPVGAVASNNSSTGRLIVQLTPRRNIGFGTANQLLGMNNGASEQEYKTLNGTANKITVTHAANSITLTIPDSPTLVTPTFSGTPTGTVTSGTYTPTITNGTNISSTNPRGFNYLRVGNIVFVTGYIDVACTAGGDTTSGLEVSLPIASNFSTAVQCQGTFTVSAASGVAFGAGIVSGSAANDRALVDFSASSTGTRAGLLSFSYEVI